MRLMARLLSPLRARCWPATQCSGVALPLRHMHRDHVPRWTSSHLDTPKRRRRRASANQLGGVSTDNDMPRQASYIGPTHFSDLPLDRAAFLRKNSERLSELLKEPGARTVAFFGGKAYVVSSRTCTHVGKATGTAKGEPEAFSFSDQGRAPDGHAPAWRLLIWHPSSESLAMVIDHNIGFLFLGLDAKGNAFFACQLIRELNCDELGSPNLFPLVDVRSEAQKMTGADAAVLALASGLLAWHRNNSYCARTGASTTSDSGGHARRVAASASTEVNEAVTHPRRTIVEYPRIDPAVIVAVVYGDWILLGRKKAWPQGRYSLLAGFVEVGETLEAAVVREVEEESGILVDNRSIRYYGSQPWPFPRSLMIGFTAQAIAQKTTGNSCMTPETPTPPEAEAAALHSLGISPEEIEEYSINVLPTVSVNDQELEDARWFHRSWMRHAQGTGDGGGLATASHCNTGGFRIPGGYALANNIIHGWIVEGKHFAKEGLIDGVADVKIDGGVFKYVLLRVSSPREACSKLIVRGDSRAAYHDHIVSVTRAEVAEIDDSLLVEVLGGGRMEVLGTLNRVYGYSAAFGQAPHHITAGLLLRWNPFLDVDVSYDGY